MPTTPNYLWNQPTVGADLDVWGDELNAQSNAIDAEMFKKANIANPIFTGNLTAPAFIGNPIAILRPTADAAQSIQFQNAGGAVQASIDTLTTGRLSCTQGFSGGVYVGTPAVVLRPTADSATAILIQSAASASLAWMDTTTARFTLGGSGGISAPLFIGSSVVVLRPTTDSAGGISMQDAAGVNKATLNTVDGTLSVTGFLASQGLVGNPSVLLQPTVDSASGIQFRNAAGGIVGQVDTSLHRMSTSYMRAVVFEGNPNVAIRPTGGDWSGAFQIQNNAGSAIVSIDTSTAQMVVNGNIYTPLYTGNPVVFRALANNASAFQFQNAGAGVVVRLDTTNNFLHSIARLGLDLANDGTPAISINKGSGGQAFVDLITIGNTASFVTYTYGAGQKWFAGTGIAEVGVGSFDIWDATGNYVPLRCHRAPSTYVEIRDRLWVGPGFATAPHGVFTVVGAAHFADQSQNIATVAQFKGTVNGAIVLDTHGVTNASGYRRGFYWVYGGDGFGIVRYPNSGAGPMIQDLTIDTAGKVGIGQGSPGYKLHVYGAGTPEAIVFTPVNNLNNTVFIHDAAGNASSGGALLLGAAGSAFYALRASFQNGTGYGVGDLVFFSRTATGNIQLSEVVRINSAGNVAIHAMPTANPGAGTHMLWADPADGYRVKWAG